MDRRPRGKKDRARRERERRKFRKTVFLVSPPPPSRAARRPAGAAGESGAAAGEVQRIYALRHRRRGGQEDGETDGWRRCAAPFALLSASSSLALRLRRRCAKTCRGVRAGGRATVRTDARCVCLAGAADDRVRVLHFVRRQTGDGPDPSARPPARSAKASLQNSRPTRRPTPPPPSPPPRVSVRFRRAGPML